MTHTKFEIKKNTHVGELNDALNRKEQQRIKDRADEKLKRKMQMLNEMIH